MAAGIAALATCGVIGFAVGYALGAVGTPGVTVAAIAALAAFGLVCCGTGYALGEAHDARQRWRARRCRELEMGREPRLWLAHPPAEHDDQDVEVDIR
jgi:hypothetical protein